MLRALSCNTTKIMALISLLMFMPISTLVHAIPEDTKTTNYGTAPEFTVIGLHKEIRLSQYKGKLVYLDFWASWCAPCKKSFPWMNALHSKYASLGLVVLAINLDEDSEDGRRFLKSNPALFEVGFDSKAQVARLFNVKAMPSSVLIDANGKILHQYRGFTTANSEISERQIKLLLEGKK